jgi:tetratricopeptide (TPR) repeat protein
MKLRLLPAARLIVCLVLAREMTAQRTQPPVRNPFDTPNTGSHPTYNFQGAVFTLNVLSDSHAVLDRQALVKLSNKQTSSLMWQTTREKGQAIFYDLPVGVYDVEVNAVGYLPSHSELKVLRGLTTYHTEITIKRDPTNVDVELARGSRLPPQVQKQLSRAVAALRSSNYRQANKEAERALKAAPSSADVNFMLGYIALQQGDRLRAQAYLTRATELDPHHLQALTVLGQLYLKDGDHGRASAFLQQAIAVDDKYWTPHYLLAETYVQDSDFEKARQQAEIAIDRGQGSAVNAQIVLGEALANLGQPERALQAFKTFLHAAPESSLASEVTKLIEEVQSQQYAGGQQMRLRLADSPSSDSALSASAAAVAIPKWQPAGVDEVRPPVAPDVSCPQEQVIQSAGERVMQFVDDVSKFAAIEEILHEELDEVGKPVKQYRRNFNYVATISEVRPGVLHVDEDRIQRSDAGQFPEHIATRGLPTLALVFHPKTRTDYDMVCEGLGQWQRQATWLVHFRQREDRPRRIKAYQIGQVLYPVALKGRAWISAESYQIVRIESELVKAIPEIKLLSDHETVEYGAVPFAKKNTTLWLPKVADLYFDFRHRHYYRRHSFDHFMLFAVDSTDQSMAVKK